MIVGSSRYCLKTWSDPPPDASSYLKGGWSPLFRLPHDVQGLNDLRLDSLGDCGVSIICDDQDQTVENILRERVNLPPDIYEEFKKYNRAIADSRTVLLTFDDFFCCADPATSPTPRQISPAEINAYRRFFCNALEYDHFTLDKARQFTDYITSRAVVMQVFEDLARSDGKVFGQSVPFSFPLVFEHGNDVTSYIPKSSLRLEFDEMPVIICKFDSGVQGKDKERMLVQGASLVLHILRLARLSKRPRDTIWDHAAVMAILFSKPSESKRTMTAQRWMFHARAGRDGDEVHVMSGHMLLRQYDMLRPPEIFRLLFHLFNWGAYLRAVGYKGGDGGEAGLWYGYKRGMEMVAECGGEIPTQQSIGNPNTGSSGSSGASSRNQSPSFDQDREGVVDGGGWEHGGHWGDHWGDSSFEVGGVGIIRECRRKLPGEKVTPFRDLLLHRGIVIETSPDNLGTIKFSHLARATFKGEAVVVKLCRRKEGDIHRQLYHSPNARNVIPLYDVIPTPTSRILLVTPLRVPLPLIHRNMAPLMLGLLDGVAFLHELLIAHRDIRPQNLVVYEQEWCLEIIDFGEAYCATSEDDRVEDFVGVESWVAPEVHNGGHDPFGADVWATGNVILHQMGDPVTFREHRLAEFATELTHLDPDRRPRLAYRDLSSLKMNEFSSDVNVPSSDEDVFM